MEIRQFVKLTKCAHVVQSHHGQLAIQIPTNHYKPISLATVT